MTDFCYHRKEAHIILNTIVKGLLQWLYGQLWEIGEFIMNSLMSVFSMDLSYFETAVPAVRWSSSFQYLPALTPAVVPAQEPRQAIVLQTDQREPAAGDRKHYGNDALPRCREWQYRKREKQNRYSDNRRFNGIADLEHAEQATGFSIVCWDVVWVHVKASLT